MNGIIESVHHYAATEGNNGGGVQSIFIAGDDGQVYFGHKVNFNRKSKHYKPGRAVTFDVEPTDRAHPAAINIDVEVPVNPAKEDEVIYFKHLPDGAYIKRIRKFTGVEVCLLIKDNTLIISCLPEYERDMVWIYQRGPSGEADIRRIV